MYYSKITTLKKFVSLKCRLENHLNIYILIQIIIKFNIHNLKKYFKMICRD